MVWCYGKMECYCDQVGKGNLGGGWPICRYCGGVGINGVLVIEDSDRCFLVCPLVDDVEAVR